MTDICVSKLTIIGSDNGLSPGWRKDIYLNKSWNIINWNLRNKVKWNLKQNSYIFIQEDAHDNIVCELVSILFWPQCVKISYTSWYQVSTLYTIKISNKSFHQPGSLYAIKISNKCCHHPCFVRMNLLGRNLDHMLIPIQRAISGRLMYKDSILQVKLFVMSSC